LLEISIEVLISIVIIFNVSPIKHLSKYLDNCSLRFSYSLAHNGLQLQEVGDFGDENCPPPLNLPAGRQA